MSALHKPQKDPVVDAQMEQLGRDLENIELMNEWGRQDSQNARKEAEKVKHLKEPQHNHQA